MGAPGLILTVPLHALRTVSGMSEGGNPRVLVAEDDRSVRESLVRALRLEGYDVDAVDRRRAGAGDACDIGRRPIASCSTS